MRRFSVLLLGIALAASARAAEPFVASTARRFAEGIIAEQQNEIQMMHLWLERHETKQPPSRKENKR